MLLNNNKANPKSKKQKSFSGIPIQPVIQTGTKINVARIDQWLANIERQNFILAESTK